MRENLMRCSDVECYRVNSRGKHASYKCYEYVGSVSFYPKVPDIIKGSDSSAKYLHYRVTLSLDDVKGNSAFACLTLTYCNLA